MLLGHELTTIGVQDFEVITGPYNTTRYRGSSQPNSSLVQLTRSLYKTMPHILNMWDDKRLMQMIDLLVSPVTNNYRFLNGG